jgi:DUF1680 family protein
MAITFLMTMNACNEKQPGPFEKIKPVSEQTRRLPFGDIKPGGWMKAQMVDDLQNGFVGHLDEIVPDLIRDDDIYGKDRLTNKVKQKDVGALAGDGEWQVQFLWWNSETQSNWYDGFVKSVMLTDDQKFNHKMDEYIDRMLSYQDEDGYMGIYAPDLRYNFTGENGELWAQASLFRILLGQYEATGDEQILNAIEKAVAVTMKAWPIDASEPFNVKDPFAGVGHGLVFTDVLDQLYQITGHQKYMDYALFLFKDYNQHEMSEVDIFVENLLDSNYRFQGHGVHTYEHLRPLVVAYYASGNPTLKKAIDQYVKKLDEYLSPSGGPIGDEWVAGRTADASETGYEYCSIHELLDSYSLLLQKTGDMQWADRMDWILFNAGQGARHPHEHSIAYCKTDNSFSMTGGLHPGENDHGGDPQTRFKYSPSHQDAAVCCVPNAGRIYPYYVKSMWLKNSDNADLAQFGDGIITALYGPAKAKTSINGKQVEISQETNYPFNLKVNFRIDQKDAQKFPLILRIPEWAHDYELEGFDGEVHAKNDQVVLIKEWQKNESFSIEFKTRIKKHNDHQNRAYLSYGPLIYALPVDGEQEVVKTFSLEGFRDLHYQPSNKEVEELVFDESKFNGFALKINPDNDDLWSSVFMEGLMKNESTNEYSTVRLYPMGSTILRQVTFENK